MIDVENNLQEVSKKMNLDIEVYGGDLGDGDEFEHYHYKYGELVSDDGLSKPYWKEKNDEYTMKAEWSIPEKV